MKQDKSYKLGIIGTGCIAETKTIPAILSLNEFDITCAYDNDKERLENICNKFSIPSLTSFEELLSKKCDAVYIASPNCYHVSYAIEALKKRLGNRINLYLWATWQNGISTIKKQSNWLWKKG